MSSKQYKAIDGFTIFGGERCRIDPHKGRPVLKGAEFITPKPRREPALPRRAIQRAAMMTSHQFSGIKR